MEKKITGYKFNLNTASDIKRMLSKIASEVYEGKLETDKGRVITYVANTAISAIKTCEVEKRLEELEKLVEERHNA